MEPREDCAVRAEDTDESPMVSIIVPVYNAEQYLRRCIESVLGQEYKNFELLLLDDGSEDGSVAICEEYAAKDPRVRVIRKENTGVSDTRNIGMGQAKGKYLQFVDSDDWITSDATRLFVRAAETYHCDMVISDFYRVVGGRVSHKGDIEEEGVMSREEFATHMMENPADFYYGVLWNKLFRRELIEAHALRMNTQISWCEDFMFNLEYILYAEVFYALRTPVYYYVKTRGSLVTQGANPSKAIRMKLMVFEYYNNFYKNVLDEEEYEHSRLQLYRFFLDAATDGTNFFRGVKRLGEERSEVHPAALWGDGIAMDSYRDRKLLEHYLEVVAMKYDLTTTEVFLLFSLSQLHQPMSRKELADYTNMSTGRLSPALSKLSSRNLIKVEEIRTTSSKKKETKKENKKEMKKDAQGVVIREPRRQRIVFLPAADPILEDLAAAQDQYDEARYAGFTEEELVRYAGLSEKIKRNIQQLL